MFIQETYDKYYKSLITDMPDDFISRFAGKAEIVSMSISDDDADELAVYLISVFAFLDQYYTPESDQQENYDTLHAHCANILHSLSYLLTIKPLNNYHLSNSDTISGKRENPINLVLLKYLNKVNTIPFNISKAIDGLAKEISILEQQGIRDEAGYNGYLLLKRNLQNLENFVYGLAPKIFDTKISQEEFHSSQIETEAWAYFTMGQMTKVELVSHVAGFLAPIINLISGIFDWIDFFNEADDQFNAKLEYGKQISGTVYSALSKCSDSVVDIGFELKLCYEYKGYTWKKVSRKEIDFWMLSYLTNTAGEQTYTKYLDRIKELSDRIADLYQTTDFSTRVDAGRLEFLKTWGLVYQGMIVLIDDPDVKDLVLETRARDQDGWISDSGIALKDKIDLIYRLDCPSLADPAFDSILTGFTIQIEGELTRTSYENIEFFRKGTQGWIPLAVDHIRGRKISGTGSASFYTWEYDLQAGADDRPSNWNDLSPDELPWDEAGTVYVRIQGDNASMIHSVQASVDLNVAWFSGTVSDHSEMAYDNADLIFQAEPVNGHSVFKSVDFTVKTDADGGYLYGLPAVMQDNGATVPISWRVGVNGNSCIVLPEFPGKKAFTLTEGGYPAIDILTSGAQVNRLTIASPQPVKAFGDAQAEQFFTTQDRLTLSGTVDTGCFSGSAALYFQTSKDKIAITDNIGPETSTPWQTVITVNEGQSLNARLILEQENQVLAEKNIQLLRSDASPPLSLDNGVWAHKLPWLTNGGSHSFTITMTNTTGVTVPIPYLSLTCPPNLGFSVVNETALSADQPAVLSSGDESVIRAEIYPAGSEIYRITGSTMSSVNTLLDIVVTNLAPGSSESFAITLEATGDQAGKNQWVKYRTAFDRNDYSHILLYPNAALGRTQLTCLDQQNYPALILDGVAQPNINTIHIARGEQGVDIRMPSMDPLLTWQVFRSQDSVTWNRLGTNLKNPMFRDTSAIAGTDYAYKIEVTGPDDRVIASWETATSLSWNNFFMRRHYPEFMVFNPPEGLGSGNIIDPSVIKDKNDDTYKMVYSGAQSKQSSYGRCSYNSIGLAISEDGVDWTAHEANPALTGTCYSQSYSWNSYYPVSYGVQTTNSHTKYFAPYVMVLADGTYRMYYAAHDYYRYSVVQYGNDLYSYRENWAIKTAVSDDGVNWTGHEGTGITDSRTSNGPDTGPAPDKITSPSVVLFNGVYHMWYERDGQILLATSENGRSFTGAGGHVLSNSPMNKDGVEFTQPHVIRDGFTFYMAVKTRKVPEASMDSISLFVSVDGRNWKDYENNPLVVQLRQDDYPLDSPSLLMDGTSGEFKLFAGYGSGVSLFTSAKGPHKGPAYIPPLADPGQTVYNFVLDRTDPLVLDGSRSQGNAFALSYVWTQTTGQDLDMDDGREEPTLAVNVENPGTYTFELYVTDGIREDAAQTLVITSHKPSAAAVPLTVPYNGEGHTKIHIFDKDESDSHTIVISSHPEWGTAFIDTDQDIHYQPGTDFLGLDRIGITVTDQYGNTADLMLPVRVTYASLDGGDDTMGMIKPDGTLWKAFLNSSNLMHAMSESSDWKQVAVEKNHTLARKKNKTLWISKYAGKMEPVSTDKWNDIAAGKDHFLAVREDGSLWAWGKNESCQLGLGDTAVRTDPVRVGSKTDWLTVAADGNQSWGIKQDGSLWAWGTNNCVGFMSYNPVWKFETPTRIHPKTDWLDIAGAWYHALALRADGTLWEFGTYRSSVEKIGEGYDIQSPRQIGSHADWGHISAGVLHSAAIKNDGSLWAWGKYLGETPVRLGTENNWITSAVGGVWHSWSLGEGGWVSGHGFCYALKKDLTLWKWTFKADGIHVNQIQDFRLFSLPYAPSIRLDKTGSGKSVLFKGSNLEGTPSGFSVKTPPSFGQALIDGDGIISYQAGSHFSGVDHFSVEVTMDNKASYLIRVPVTGAGTVIAAGKRHSVCVRSDSTLWEWGTSSTLWEWGTSGLQAEGYLYPKKMSEQAGWMDAAAGANYSLALKTDGSLWAWGDHDKGTLLPSGTGADAPTLISGAGLWQKIFSGSTGYHSYTVGIRPDSSLWVWGEEFSSPQKMSARNVWQAVDIGSEILALDHSGKIYICRPWQLSVSACPQGNERQWHAVASGNGFVWAVRQDGTLWAWGMNTHGQLGTGDTEDRSEPVQIGTASDWIEVEAGNGFALALKQDGTVWGAGRNQMGQLGTGDYKDVHIIRKLSGHTSWAGMSANGDHSMLVDTDETVHTSGANSLGQLGNGTLENQFAFLPVLFNQAPVPKADARAVEQGQSCKIRIYPNDRNIGDTHTFVVTSQPQMGQINGPQGSVFSYTAGTASFGKDSFTVQVTDQAGNRAFLEVFVFVLPEKKVRLFSEYYTAKLLKPDGTLFSWNTRFEGGFEQKGSHNTWKTVTDATGYGILDDGTLVDMSGNTPAALKDIAFVDIASGKSGSSVYITAGLSENGDIWAWGNNWGQSDHIPAQLGAGKLWKGLAAGGDRLIGVDEKGRLTQWKRWHLSSPEPVAQDCQWLAAAVGSGHTLGIQWDGSLWAWGANGSGQLGIGSTDDAAGPVRIGDHADWIMIDADGDCSAALRANGSVWAWGKGIGNTPVQLDPGIGWSAVSICRNVILALEDTGDLYTWSLEGNSLVKTKSVFSAAFNAVALPLTGISETLLQTRIKVIPEYTTDAQTQFSILEQPENGTCVFGTGGILDCTMTNRFKGIDAVRVRISLGADKLKILEIPIIVKDTDISAQSDYVLARRADGSIWSWGSNKRGTLGNGTQENANLPVRISASSDWRSVSAAYYNAYAVKTDGSLWGWGNPWGCQAWDNLSDPVLEPRRISNQTGWKAVAWADDKVYSLKSDGTLWFWGYQYPDPVLHQQYGTDTDWKKIGMASSPFGLKEDGSLWFLGDDKTFFSWNNARWKDVAGFPNHWQMLGIRDDGTLWRWEMTSRHYEPPVQVTTGTDWIAVFAGDGHFAAMKKDGSLWTFGQNHSAQVGTGSLEPDNVETPFKIFTENTVDAVGLGSRYTIVSDRNNGFSGVGANHTGYLGIGNEEPMTQFSRIRLNQIPKPTAGPLVTIVDQQIHTQALANDHDRFDTHRFVIVSGPEQGQADIDGSGLLTYTPAPGFSGRDRIHIAVTDQEKNAAECRVDVMVVPYVHTRLLPRPQYQQNPIVQKYDMSIWTLPTGNGADNLKYYRETHPKGKWKQITTSVYFTLARKTDGSLWLWGYDYADPEKPKIEEPVLLSDGVEWRSFGAARVNAYLIHPDGTLRGWGKDFQGQTFAVIGDRSDWVFLSTTSVRSRAWGITKDGALWRINGMSEPVRLGSDNDWALISAGYDKYSFAIKGNGSLWRVTENSAELIGTDQDWMKVFACGDWPGYIAQKWDGSIWTGQASFLEPVRIGSDNDWMDVDISEYFTYAVKPDGTVWSLGRWDHRRDDTEDRWIYWFAEEKAQYQINTMPIYMESQNFRLMPGETIQTRLHSEIPIQQGTWQIVHDVSLAGAEIKDGVLVASAPFAPGIYPLTVSVKDRRGDARQLTVYYQVCPVIPGPWLVIDFAAQLWVWQDKSGSAAAPYDIRPGIYFPEIRWAAVDRSRYHFVGRDSSGMLYAWGRNDHGQVGNGERQTQYPYLVQTPVKTGSPEYTWSAASAGKYASAAVRSDGTLWAWGQNSDGNLGIESGQSDLVIPGRVGTEQDWAEVIVTDDHLLALKQDATLWQIQARNGFSSLRQASDFRWRVIAGEYGGWLGIRQDGTLWAWGEDDNGRFGMGQDNKKYGFPVRVGLDTDWVAVSSTWGHTLALKSDGTLWAFGKNHNGQLGIPNVTESLEPARVGISDQWVMVQVAGDNSMAYHTEEGLCTWGNHPGHGHDSESNISVPLCPGLSQLKTGRLKGDFDNNGTIDINDLHAALRILARYSFPGAKTSGRPMTLGDTNADKRIGLEDALHVLDHIIRR